MGSLLGGKTTTKVEPWKPQAKQLENTFNEAKGIYDAKKGSSWYEGDLHAGLDPLTQQGIAGAGIYAQGAGRDAANQVGNSASNILSGSSDQLIGTIGRYADMAGQDPAQANIAAAGQYANNPHLQGQIDAVGSDIRRNLGENIMPSIDREATASGNINSSRAGVAEGIAARGANEAFSRAAGDMRYGAYESGLDRAESARTANMGAMGDAAGLYGNAVQTGMTGAEGGQQMNLQMLNTMIQSGQISQADAQAMMEADFNRWQGNDTRDQSLLNQYYGVVGDKNWGNTTTQKTQGSILGAALGIGSMAAGFGFSPFGGKK
jgi:hypothetical protein